ncbi:MAG TPA: hypothetical protein VFJ30_18905 [Phycisphaerae bacterium]|nr:hypothetical protein [Phycisphaerae bacterium]
MEPDRASRQLAAIRELMERPVRYSTQSGLSGIIAGLAALAGCLADSTISRAYAQDEVTATGINAIVWAGVFAAAFAGATICTRLRERKQGMSFWSNVKKRILRTILPPFLAGVGLTAAIVYRHFAYPEGPNLWGLIPAIWMLFYGVALWQVGEFSVVEIRAMAVAFLLAGILCAAELHTSPYLTLGVTFGGFHIVYGVVVWLRHGG